MRLRALTFNVLFKGDSRARLRGLAEKLNATDYDVVCLQEVISPLNLLLLRKLTEASYPHMVHAVPLPYVTGGLVTLSRWPIAVRRYLAFPYTFPVRREGLLRKGVLVSRLRIADQRLTVLNTHLTANMDDDWSSRDNRYVKAEIAELRHLEGIVKRLNPTSPLLLMGDFNVPRDAPYFREFVAAAGLRDPLDDDTQPTYRPTRRWPSPPPIDQLLVRPSETRDLDVVPRLCFKDEVLLATGQKAYLSDHYGIEADITLRPKSPRHR